MKSFFVIVAGAAILPWPTTAGAATAVASVSSLQAKVDDAQKDVNRAQADFSRAKEKAFDNMSAADKSQWQQAESKFESAMAKGSSSQTAAQKEAVEKVESHTMKDPDRGDVDDARDKEVEATARLKEAKAQLAADTRGTNNHDDSSQATQPENRTQNGANFSIRSQRDSENHPPLPASP